jgi:D-arabinose 1-dehydrogenase-like Zn-dependent alcohol dehydrogenase
VPAVKEAEMSVPRTMQATVLMARDRFELQERPVPELGAEDVLLRVRACGV